MQSQAERRLIVLIGTCAIPAEGILCTKKILSLELETAPVSVMPILGSWRHVHRRFCLLMNVFLLKKGLQTVNAC